MATSFDVAGVSARAEKALVKNQSNPEGEFSNVSPQLTSNPQNFSKPP